MTSHKRVWLEDWNPVPLGQQEVVVYGEEGDEGEEERRGREEVPHVVVVEEVHHVTQLVPVPRLGWAAVPALVAPG